MTLKDLKGSRAAPSSDDAFAPAGSEKATLAEMRPIWNMRLRGMIPERRSRKQPPRGLLAALGGRSWRWSCRKPVQQEIRALIEADRQSVARRAWTSRACSPGAGPQPEWKARARKAELRLKGATLGA